MEASEDSALDKDEKPWWYKEVIRASIFVILTGLAGGLVGGLLTGLNAPADFNIAVKPVCSSTNLNIVKNPAGAVQVQIYRGGVGYANVTVKNGNWFKSYDYPVFLYANHSDHFPHDVNVSFKPAEADVGRPGFNSIATITVGPNASEGEHPITIYGLGGDELKRRCTLMVNIEVNRIDLSLPRLEEIPKATIASQQNQARSQNQFKNTNELPKRETIKSSPDQK